MPSTRGGRRPGAGRKPKEVTEDLRERLSPYEDEAFKALATAIESGQAWAVKMFFLYRYGKPVQRVEVEPEGWPVMKNVPSWFNDE